MTTTIMILMITRRFFKAQNCRIVKCESGDDGKGKDKGKGGFV